MKNSAGISDMGVLWLSHADKLIDKDVNFYKEYDFIHQALSGLVDTDG